MDAILIFVRGKTEREEREAGTSQLTYHSGYFVLTDVPTGI